MGKNDGRLPFVVLSFQLDCEVIAAGGESGRDVYDSPFRCQSEEGGYTFVEQCEGNMFSFQRDQTDTGDLPEAIRLSLLNRFSLIAILVLSPFALHHFLIREPAWGAATTTAVLLCLGNLIASACNRKPALPVWIQYLLLLAALLVGLSRSPDAAIFWCFVIPVTYRGVCTQHTARWLDRLYLPSLIYGAIAWLPFAMAIRFCVAFCLLCFLLDLLFDLFLSQLQEWSTQAFQDPLTGVGNRRQMERELEHFEATFQPEGTASLLMLDVDRLKAVNDSRGHQAGDVLLQTVAQVLQERLNELQPGPTTLCRIGGDEFCVLLVDVDELPALAISEQLRSALLNDDSLQKAGISASAGVAERRRGDSIASWLTRADERLYAVKRQGGNGSLASENASTSGRNGQNAEGGC